MSDGEEIRAAQPPPPMPALGDGYGLNADEVARMLAEKANIPVSPDDPILMMVPLCNAFLSEERRLLEKHSEVLAHVLADKTGGFVASVRQTADELGQTLSSAAVRDLHQAMQEHKAAIQWWGWLASCAALLNLVLVALLWRACGG